MCTEERNVQVKVLPWVQRVALLQHKLYRLLLSPVHRYQYSNNWEVSVVIKWLKILVSGGINQTCDLSTFVKKKCNDILISEYLTESFTVATASNIQSKFNPILGFMGPLFVWSMWK